MKDLVYKSLDSDEALKKLIKLIQNAHAGEKAAANAYYGHYNSLFVRCGVERNEIFEIYQDELHHRKRLFEMLQILGAKPSFFKEILMYTVGFVIGFLCLFGGWLIPMYGAGKLESENVEEYEVAARLAYLSGKESFFEDFLLFAEIEWDHELYFRQKAMSHRLYKYLPKWKSLNPKESIRALFLDFSSEFASGHKK